MKILTMKTLLSIILLILLSCSVSAQLFGGEKQKPQKVETEGKAKFDLLVQENRVAARKALMPYKYYGTKSTYFSYKTYAYVKEIDILTVEKTDYLLSFNAMCISDNKITVQIYDRSKNQNGRTLLYENKDIGGNEFVVSLNDLNETFRKEKLKTSSLPFETIQKMRLKKVYVNYIIPGVDREINIATNGTDQKQETVIQFSAMIVAVGYQVEF